jgi:D-alanine-D-alanine ligase-like ATP-grasp enzyme
MTPEVPVLLASTATRWYGAARAPRAFAKSGFSVTLLTPRDSLAESSRFVARVAYLPQHATAMQWIHALAATVKAAAPALIVPCDDMAFRLLAMIAVAPPPELQPALQAALAALIRRSLGDPAHYRTSIDRTLLPAAAAGAGVPLPAHAPVDEPDAAERFAARCGYPVVLKRAYAAVGGGVRIASDADELAEALAALAAPNPEDVEPDASRLLVQRHIDGHICHQNVAAWQGRMLAGYAGDRVQAHGGLMAPGTVVRYRDAPDLRAHSERLVRALGMSGLFTIDYLIERDTQTPYLLEIARCVGQGTHHGAVMNVDLCAALHAALHERPVPTRAALDPAEERVYVQFPGEWLRDPSSRWLRRHPVDLPWDDPDLLVAKLALRRT